MKRNLFIAIVIAVAVAFLASCEDKQIKISMKPQKTELSSDFSECFEVVDEPVTASVNANLVREMLAHSLWQVKIRRTDVPLPFDENINIAPYGSNCADGCYVGFGLKITDADGNIIQENKPTEYNSNCSIEDLDALLKLNAGEEMAICWPVSGKCVRAKEPLKFTVSCAYNLIINTQKGIENDLDVMPVEPAMPVEPVSTSY